MNIISLHQRSASKNLVYVHNHVRFMATNRQEAEVISRLRATGLVVDIGTFKWDEVNIAKMKETKITLSEAVPISEVASLQNVHVNEPQTEVSKEDLENKEMCKNDTHELETGV